MASTPRYLSRRLLVAIALLGLFVVVDLALFGWLIFRSLSRREVERVLLETRHEAEGLAGRIAGRAAVAGDLLTAVAVERETETYIDSVLRQRELVETVEVRDQHGVLVWRGRSEVTVPLGPPPVGSSEAARGQPEVETKSVERQSSYDVTVPIGEFGSLRVGVSPQELARRTDTLRRDLLRQTAAIGVLTTALLASAYLLIARLLRRGRRLEEQAAEAERLAYVGTLAAGLAHEIRNPLNSLSLNMQLLEEELSARAGGASGNRLLAITRSEIGRLERLVSDFLAYARPRPLELSRVRAVRLLEEVREILAPQLAASEVEVTIDDATGGALVEVDPEQMRQLLLNLVHNAVAAASDVGRQPRLRLAARRDAHGLALDVADNGRGVAAADRERVFEIFYSTRKGGTGLGLAIAQRIARAHGGELRLGDSGEDGTTFTVALPAPQSSV